MLRDHACRHVEQLDCDGSIMFGFFGNFRGVRQQADEEGKDESDDKRTPEEQEDSMTQAARAYA